MKKVILAALTFAPAFAFAAGEFDNVKTLVQGIGAIVKVALPVVVGLALLAFFWGLVKFIFAQGNEEAKADAKKIMLWGLVALFVMVSVWGLIQFMVTSLGITPSSSFTIPTVPTL